MYHRLSPAGATNGRGYLPSATSSYLYRSLDDVMQSERSLIPAYDDMGVIDEGRGICTLNTLTTVYVFTWFHVRNFCSRFCCNDFQAASQQ